MKTRIITILCLSFLIGTQGTYSQSFKGLLKKAVQQAGNKVGIKSNTQKQTQTSRNKQTQTSRDQQLQKQYETMMAGAPETKDEDPTVRLPDQHTALFAPLGYPIEAQFGVKKAKPSQPPREATKQVDWSGKQISPSNYDNQSLVDDYQFMSDLVVNGYIENLTPAFARYDMVEEEFLARGKVLNELVKCYKEIRSQYSMDDNYQWVINHAHNTLARLLESDIYKRTIRSSLTPLFKAEWTSPDGSQKVSLVNDDTKKYFAEHGGYENAINVEWTKWDPKPNKQTISTSAEGQTATVLDENGSGATVDMGGLKFVLHNKGPHAFLSEVVKTAVAGKDIVIPDYIPYKGKKYPVTDMRAEVFYGTTPKSIKLSNNLEEIRNATFRGTPITEIVIPASVKVIQGSVFQDCKNLAKVVFESDNITSIGGCFQRCTALRSIKFPRHIEESMSYDMFTGCTNLTDVTLPENLPEIPATMFEGCKKLTTLKVPATVKKVGGRAFSDSGITALDLSNVTEFDSFCFMNCKSLKTVKLNSSLKENFLTETYEQFLGCPLLEVKYVNNKYVYPAGFIFVDGK